MPVLGAVLTLHDQPTLRAGALSALSTDPRITVGEPQRGRLPVVLATDTRADDKALWRSLEELPGITHLELVTADFSDLTDLETTA